MPTLAAPLDQLDENGRRNWKPVWLEAFRNLGTVKEACKVARISKQRVYQVREKDQEFAAAWLETASRQTELLEETSFQKALAGSERALDRELKARRPAKYGDALKLEGTVTHEIDQAVNERIEAAHAEIERLTERLANMADSGEAQAPGPPASEPVGAGS
jgi:hypothetical protein